MAIPVPVDARILDVTASHVRQFGLRRTTVVSIAEAAGMSHANVYRYFPSKDALIDAVTDDWLKPVEAGLREIGDAPDPAYDKLERTLAAIHRAYRNKFEADANIFRLLAEAASADRPIARRHRNRIRVELHRIVDEGMASGVFATGDLRRAVTLIFDAAHCFIHPAAVVLEPGASRATLDARFERVSNLVRRALIRGVK